MEIIRGIGPLSTSGYVDGQMYVSITNTEEVMTVLVISWIFNNAIERNCAHPPENVVSDNYELISIDRKSLYNNST